MKKLLIEVSEQQLYFLWNLSVRKHMFLREDPRKSWSDKEKRECIASWVRSMAEEEKVSLGYE